MNRIEDKGVIQSRPLTMRRKLDKYSQGGDKMLVIGIKNGEYAMIGENIRIHIVKSKKHDLRLAIDAPKHLSIKRGECIEKSPKTVKKKSQRARIILN